MRLRPGLVVAVSIVAGLALGGCSRNSGEEATRTDPASVEPVAGTAVSRVTLTAGAAERLDIQTAPVRSLSVVGRGTSPDVIPYAALLYDPNGQTWVYTNPEPLVFVRQPITVDHIEGDVAVLSSGPPLGTAVVTVGAAELLGTEYGVGEE